MMNREDSQKAKKLLDSEQFYSNIINSSNDAIVIEDLDGIIIDWNKAAERIYGYGAEEVIGKSAHTFMPVDRSYDLKKILTRIAQGEFIKNYETKRQKKDGSLIDVSITISPIKDRDGKIIAASAIVRDITEHRLAEEQVRWEKSKFELIARNIRVGVILLDNENNILFANASARFLCSYSSDLDIKSLEKFFLSFQDKKVHDSFHSCTSVNPYVILEGEKEGRIYSFSFNCLTTYKTNQETVVNRLVWIEDITDSKLLERAKDEFILIVAHELRTPLTAIRGNMSIMRDYSKDAVGEKEIAAIADDSYNASVRLIQIVNDFLDVSSLEQKKIKYRRDIVDLSEIILETIKTLKVLADQKTLYLNFNSPGFLCLVHGDKERVKQVLLNLISNGINYTEKGGVTVEIRKKADTCDIIVKDTGIGISKKNQGLLFKKFQHAGEDLYRRDVTKGTGVGLYISKLLTEQMNGDIGLVESELDKGSTFHFALKSAS